MHARTPAAIVLISVSLAAVLWQNPVSQAPPQFRSEIDLVTLDVVVLDRNRRPVTGLTHDDFVLLEDGKPQIVSALDEVGVEGPEGLTVGWLKAPPVDVASNRHGESRLFVLLIDDATLPADPYMVRRARDTAKAFIEGLGPTDLAAVIFTRDNRNAQDFTRDRGRLLAAANRLSAGFLGGTSALTGMRGRPPGGAVAMDSNYFLASLNTLGRVAEHLEAVPMRRKVVAYLSIGVPVSLTDVSEITSVGSGSMLGGEIQQAMLSSLRRTVDRAQRANVAIYAFNPAGLDGLRGFTRRAGLPPGTVFNDSLLTLANNTGGRAFVNSNDFRPGIVQLFDETRSYYLLGYTPSPPSRPGDYRRVEVKVKRPGVLVISRKGYFASRLGAASDTDPLSGGVKAISGVLPDPGLPLRGIAAPLFETDGTTAVALTLAFDRTAALAEAGDAVDVVTHLFDPEGRPRAEFEQTASLCAGPGWCELTSLIAASPGRQVVRIGVKHVKSGKTGSVYLDVDVPDFKKRQLSVSGLMLEAIPAWPRTSDDRIRARIPVLPTTRREFTTTDVVSLVFRVYQRSDRDPRDVMQTLRITDESDTVVKTLSATLRATDFKPTSAVEQHVALPLATLPLGRYLISLELSAQGVMTIERQLMVTVR
ncbi:MAG: VWA domain-containing protein [Vicinamibacterales bacterium]